MDKDIYYGYLLRGDLHGAIGYVKQFPEHCELYDRFLDVFENKRYISYDVSPELNCILAVYQQYYRDVFYLGVEKEQSADLLRGRLAGVLGITKDEIRLCDLEQTYLPKLFQSWGLHFMGGRTSGYYGPYIWQTTEKVSYDVELPDGVQTYAVKLLDGFIFRSWMDYLSFGEIGPGGWADGDGYINCVKSAWDFDSERFQVCLLKHEAQHVRDLEKHKDMASEDLEYRAKLVELIYSSERNLLQAFAQEASSTDRRNGHAMAAHRILKGYANKLGVERIEPSAIPVKQIQAVAKLLYENSI